MRVLFLFLLLIGTLSCSASNRDPLATRIVVEDVGRFWHAWDLAQAAESREQRVAIFQREYLDAGSPGLRAFTRLRIGDAGKLVDALDAHPRYYRQLRERSLDVGRYEAEISAALVNMARLYPDAVFPDVYFLIGRMNSGGTLDDAGLLIGLEMFGRAPDSPVEELGDWHRAVIKGMEGLPHVVTHELVHFQQRYDIGGQPTLLQASIGEGVADVVAELASGAHTNQHVHEWADPRIDVLWPEFRAAMHGTDYAGWLYDTDPGGGRPADLGYWMGYRIARGWYDRQPDKAEALRTLLTVRDFDALVEGSGLPGATAAAAQPAAE